MVHRVLILLRARLASGRKGGLPVAALGGLAVTSTLLCALVGDQLPPFAFAIFALTLTTAMLAIPLLGELGWLLRADEAAEWVSALPVRASELRAARTVHLLLLLWTMALMALLPAAWFAPAAMEWTGRLLLPFLGLGLATLLATALLLVQSALGGRAEGVLVLFQTAVVGGVLLGVVLGLGAVPELAQIAGPDDPGARWMVWFPPAWFAGPFAPAASGAWLAPGLSTVIALATLLFAPAPAAREVGRREPPLAFVLRPARALATRLWVRPSERAMFDLVYDALPREREFVLRAYPMLGIPLAFLVVDAMGGEGGPGPGRADLLALLLFSVGIYLPILLSQVPVSASHEARWLHECAPVAERDVVAGTIKALAVRFLLPLYVLLSGLAALLGHADIALRLTVPGFLTSLVVMRLVYPTCVSDRPLSVAPDRTRTNPDWIAPLAVIGLGLALLAILAHRFLHALPGTLGLIAALVVAEVLAARFARLPGRGGTDAAGG